MDSSLLINSFEKIGINLSETQVEQFDRYYSILVEKNKVMNLTAITEYEDVVFKHFIDSCSIIRVLKKENLKGKFLSGASLLDLGTGAGFPGIPLKIVFPELNIILMDSLKKRINFLDEVIKELNLDKCRAVHARAEEFARQDGYRESFDFVVSRAVARLSTLSEFCIPFLKIGGYFLPYKSSNAADEINEAGNAITILGCELVSIEKIELSGKEDIIRLMPVIKKIKNTPGKYPRVGKNAEKKPL